MRLTKTRRPLQQYTPNGPKASPGVQAVGPSEEFTPDLGADHTRSDGLGSLLGELISEAQAIETRRGVSEGDTLLPGDARFQRVRRR